MLAGIFGEGRHPARSAHEGRFQSAL